VFCVIVYRRLVASGAEGWLEREVEMPFPHFVGLVLRGICCCSEDDDDGDEIAEVAWNVNAQVFHVWLHGDEGNNHESLQAALEVYGDAWRFTPGNKGNW
jgi:hypothetical protein